MENKYMYIIIRVENMNDKQKVMRTVKKALRNA